MPKHPYASCSDPFTCAACLAKPVKKTPKKKSSVSPTQRSLKKLRKEGYTVFIVEHYNAFIRCRMDLFGFADLLCLRLNEVLAVQTTTDINFNARVKKILEHKNYKAVKESGIKIVVHGWKKLASGWECREEYL